LPRHRLVLGRSYALRSLRSMDERQVWSTITPGALVSKLRETYVLVTLADDAQLAQAVGKVLIEGGRLTVPSASSGRTTSPASRTACRPSQPSPGGPHATSPG
jgi:hypothetical protein